MVQRSASEEVADSSLLDGRGVCVLNPCPRAHLYFPDDDEGGGGGDGGSVRCHKVGSRGPCALGELVVFEKYSGKSYRGECGCSPGYNQVRTARLFPKNNFYQTFDYYFFRTTGLPTVAATSGTRGARALRASSSSTAARGARPSACATAGRGSSSGTRQTGATGYTRR